MYPQVLCQHRLTWWNISDLVFFCSVQLVHAGNTVAFATMLVVFQFCRSVLQRDFRTSADSYFQICVGRSDGGFLVMDEGN